MQSFAVGGTYFADKVIPEEIVKPLETMSGGRIKITHNFSGSIVPDAEMHTAVGKGIIDMAITLNSYYSATMPIAALEYGYPGQYASIRDCLQFIRQGGEDLLRKAYMETFNIYHLWPIYDYSLDMVSTKPIPDLASIKGLKIRAPGSTGTVLGKAGASVVMMPGTELYTALSTKVIDAACYGAMNDVFSLGLQDVAKHAVIGLYKARLTADVVINPTVFNSLPDDLKEIVLRASISMGATGGYYNDWQNGIKTAEYKTKGGTIYDWATADRNQLAAYSLQIMDELAAKDPKYAGEAVKIFKTIFDQR